MANDLNQCTFVGRLGRDPELRTFASGDQVVNFSIAVSESWKDRETGEKKERTEWINLVASGGLAKVVGDYARKGSQVTVTGKLRNRKWTDKDGQERYSTEIRVDHFQLTGGRQDSGDGGHDTPRTPAPAPRQQQRASAPPPSSDGWDDGGDIPFITASAFCDMTPRKQRRMARYDY